MAGTKAGGIQSAHTNKTKYGDDFFVKIGAIGGRKGRTGGFYANHELAKTAGTIGGAISRKGNTPKLNKRQARAARSRVLEEMSQLQTTKLSDKYGVKRSW